MLILALVSLSIYYFSVKEREESFRGRIEKRALYSAKVYADVKDSNFSVLRRLDVSSSAFFKKSITITGYKDAYVYMYSDSTGDSLYLTKEIIEKAKIDGATFFTHGNKKAVAIHHVDKNSNFIVAVSAIDKDGQEYLVELNKILLVSLLLAVLLSFFAGIIFARKLVYPIERITGEVNLITSVDLSKRVKIDSEKNELTKLAETFNNLLNRLQDSFAIQRRFISNASHELSTPLTSVSSQLEVAMQKNRTQEEYKEVIVSVYEDIKELQLLTQSLLDIAKAGSQGAINLEEVRLDEVLFKVVSDIQKQNKDYRAALDFDVFPEDEKMLTVFGNTNLLYSALKNIIENGCKYSDSNRSTISAEFKPAEVLIKVHNQGEVIPENDIQNIFQPFFRADSAQGKPGFGLGLTLAKNILSLHKGTITVDSTKQTGTVFIINIPNILSLH
ncbi:HAMP domain-containing sensor histidine kinase [Ferruginibacter sp.]